MGAITVVCLMPALQKDYAQSHLRTSLFAMAGACLIYPSAILVYTRKAIAQRHGDWKITLFILGITYVLFRMVR